MTHMNCISESFKVSSSHNSPTCPHTSQITYITSEIENNNHFRWYAIFLKNTNSVKGGCAFLESGWSVKVLGMAIFIFASSPGPARTQCSGESLDSATFDMMCSNLV